jgi:hypothetical protein
MKIFFAGCARDCSEVVAANISALLAVGDMARCDELRIYIAENNSKDNTRDVIARLADQDSRLIPILLEDLDEEIPVREARIAFCRDRLLDEICKTDSDALYVPIDLDSDIASSLDADAFMKACELVASGQCSGVFPSSSPYYYDIHALREAEWCPGSCWKEIQDANARGALWSLLVNIRYVSSRQKPHDRLQSQGLIPIDSAFGGVGIYSLSKVLRSLARYSSPDLEKEHLKLCEHVVFNAYLEDLFINPEWAISAPPEHIEFCLLPRHKKILRIARAALGDVKRLPFVVARRVKWRITQRLGC